MKSSWVDPAMESALKRLGISSVSFVSSMDLSHKMENHEVFKSTDEKRFESIKSQLEKDSLLPKDPFDAQITAVRLRPDGTTLVLMNGGTISISPDGTKVSNTKEGVVKILPDGTRIDAPKNASERLNVPKDVSPRTNNKTSDIKPKKSSKDFGRSR